MAELLRDREGDVWERQPDGRLNLVVTRYDGALGLTLTQRETEDAYGSLVPVATAEDANLVDFVRELRELCDRWATKLGV